MTSELSPVPGARNNSASLRRALGILIRLGDDPDRSPWTLSALCEDLGMNKSTLLRLIQPLIDARFVEVSATGHYRLGWRNAQLGHTYLAGVDLHRSMHDVLVELSESTSETTHLVAADFPNVVYVDKVDSPRPVRMASRIGNAQPAYCTSVGKAMLAFADDEVVRAVIRKGMPARMPNTLTTAAALRSDLEAIRERGYAIDNLENEEGVRCVAAPIFDASGQAVSALSVSAPEERLPYPMIEELAPRVIAAADEISRRLGARR